MALTVDTLVRQGEFTLDARFESAGRVTALFGPSGSGKTTLVRVIAGLVRPARARITLDGTTLADTATGPMLPSHRRRIGYVFQDARLLPHLSVRQNLLYGRFFATDKAGRARIDEVVALLGLGALLGRRPAGLSGGERQRVAIGRALLSAPRLILLDEPMAALDEARRAEILPYLERLRDEAGVPMVYVSHATQEVARLADTVVRLEAGRVVAIGPVAQVLGQIRDEPGSVVDGRIAGHDGAHGLTSLATAIGPLLVPALPGAPGQKIRVWIRARDVMIATGPLGAVSALNVLETRITALRPVDAGTVDLELACGDGLLVARITRLSTESLALAPGVAVRAVVKSVSFDPGF